VTIDMDPIEDLVSLFEALTPGTEYADIEPVPMKSTSLFPDATIKRHRKIFDNYEDFSFGNFHMKSRRMQQVHPSGATRKVFDSLSDVSELLGLLASGVGYAHKIHKTLILAKPRRYLTKFQIAIADDNSLCVIEHRIYGGDHQP